jgi:dTDP-4-dehydrorhamnose reductase
VSLAVVAGAIANKPHNGGEAWVRQLGRGAAPPGPQPAGRPTNSVLSNGRFRNTFGFSLPSWEQQLEECLSQLRSVTPDRPASRLHLAAPS